MCDVSKSNDDASAENAAEKPAAGAPKCNWKHCPGWTIDWLGFVKPCGQCRRFEADDEDAAATAAREFIASFAVVSREDGREPCDPNCLGWAVFERQGSEMPGFDIERCNDCGIYADDDEAMVAAMKWLMDHLTHPEKYPRKSAVKKTIGDRPDLDAEVDDEATSSPARRKVTKGAGVSLKETVGRTIARLEHGTTEGAYGEEPMVTLVFTDGTHHGFVLAHDGGNEQEDAHG